ncbi:3-isopropylmalate dehydratase [Geomicrobium sp. JCM 19039]|uniref:LeuD/DmdB family oxidoreductase small subunit n=1 Tax=Geomicrobium sp. JCM 19039 TaxID=1460636 RepID=UPI00045F2145|nr:3-isopropylmalate dehydratase [Geomicrobium sp. JCM 19039]GAK14689.1 3-isopropylmalate dehydratase small subunit [Geomicrobium sp. JCM 19039]
MIYTGDTHVYEVNNIDTDRIIPGKYTKTLDFQTFAAHVLEDLDPEFTKRAKAGDILVVGENFGCGSSREQAPLAIKSKGISVIIARSFARIFFRNAVNVGMPVIEVPNHTIQKDDQVEVNLAEGTVKNLSTDDIYTGTVMPSIMIQIFQEGGLGDYLKKHKTYHV